MYTRVKSHKTSKNRLRLWLHPRPHRGSLPRLPFLVSLSLTASFQNSLKTRIKLHKIAYCIKSSIIVFGCGVTKKGGRRENGGKSAMVVGDRRLCTQNNTNHFARITSLDRANRLPLQIHHVTPFYFLHLVSRTKKVVDVGGY